uniref:Uncharacterized protein n=1 Tax=Amphimedon queenslandica TaxID=400682 RepID=A0A1X7TMN7_AMPQE
MRYWVPRSDPKGGHDFSHTPGRNPLPSADPPLPSHMIGTKSSEKICSCLHLIGYASIR